MKSAHITTILAVYIGQLLLAPIISAKSFAFKPARQKFLDPNDDAGEQMDAFDFGKCHFNTFMCCWSNRGGGKNLCQTTRMSAATEAQSSPANPKEMCTVMGWCGPRAQATSTLNIWFWTSRT
ncbi:unnamed protein product [Ectocarpus sp. 13 AM-2016]